VNDDPLGRLRSALDGRYRIERLLGEGGMATVYLAFDTRHDRPVAIKVLRPGIAAAYGAQRFLSEIRVTARLQHPNVLPLFDSGDADGLLYYVMPFVAGESLRELLRRESSLPVQEVVRIARAVASALDHAHRQGVVHRDVKPGNVLLSEGEPLVCDFGIALTVDSAGDERLTEAGASPGTSAYMSPEQAFGGEVGPRSDVYSLGCVVFEMLTGEPPFAGRNPQVVRFRHASEPIPSVRDRRSTVPPHVEDAVARALSKEPAARFESATAFVDALEVPGARRRPRVSRPMLVGIVGAIAALTGTWALASRGRERLDPNRVLVYPLVLPDGYAGPATVGEDVATMIGNALDGTGPLRWTDGWTLLDPRRRNDIRLLTLVDARHLARARGDRYFVTGRLVSRGDSVEVFLELNDVRNDDVAARGSATGPDDMAWRTGLRAVNGLLPVLIPGGTQDITGGWVDRSPTAIANFLLGESALRRVHLQEALERYRNAVAADSTFAIAAIRGAQAAVWNHRAGEAESLITVALRNPLPPRYERFASGYRYYLAGRGDSAVAALRGALDAAPEMAVAWAQIGEVYTHLLPLTGEPDSLADAAFTRARRLDPSAANLLLHPIEIRLRRGEADEARPMIEQFLAEDPDTTLANQVRIMESCARRGAHGVAWNDLAGREPLSLLYAAKAFGGVGTATGCAEAAFDALLRVDTAATDASEGRRWVALMGAMASRMSRGRTSEAEALADDFVRRWHFGTSIDLVAAPAFPAFAERARALARQDVEACGKGYEGCGDARRLWEDGLVEALYGRADVAAGVGGELKRRAHASMDAYDRGLARSMTAVLAFAHADTTRAMELLTSLVPDAATTGSMAWDEAEPRGFERMLLGRLLLARGQAQRALDVTSMFDSSNPLVYAFYLTQSLELRARAARAVGDHAGAAAFEARLDQIRDRP
jgi:tetratricopeptide (TPR) repeat protein